MSVILFVCLVVFPILTAASVVMTLLGAGGSVFLPGNSPSLSVAVRLMVSGIVLLALALVLWSILPVFLS